MLKYLFLPSLSNAMQCNTLAYLAHSQVMKKMKYCEYIPSFFLNLKNIFFNNFQLWL
jgi:hypothetical protein